MSEGEFSHRGNLCTFETMMLAFGLENPVEKVARGTEQTNCNDGRAQRLEVLGQKSLPQFLPQSHQEHRAGYGDDIPLECEEPNEAATRAHA